MEHKDLGGITAYQVLVDRQNWLTARAKAKESIGWEFQYDLRERDALEWAIEALYRELYPEG